jgi:putative aldouronate transport system substrate-binding protein
MDEEPFPTEFLVFTEEQQYVIDNKWTEIQTYVQKMQVEFITGVTDIATGWDAYCETLKKMGIEEVVAVYQDAYETLMSK